MVVDSSRHGTRTALERLDASDPEAPDTAAPSPPPSSDTTAVVVLGRSPGALTRAARSLARVRGADDGLRLPPLRRPFRPAVPSLHRSKLAAWWSARRAKVELHEFLSDRLSQYLHLAASAIGPERLPLVIAIDAGRVTVTPRAAAPAPGDWFVRYLRAHGEPALSIDMERARMEVARAETAFGQARDRLVLERRELEAAARAPSLVGCDGDEARPHGRPPVPPPWSAAIGGFVVVLALAVAWQFALSLVRGAGVGPADIAVEAQRRPVAIALPLVLALGASASLFVLVAAGLRRAQCLLPNLPARWHAAAQVLAGGACLAMAVGLAWAILGRGGASPGGAAPFLVAITFALASPLLLAFGRRLESARAEAVRVAAEWDAAHRAAVARHQRAGAMVGATEQECSTHEAARAAWAQRSCALRKRAAEAARLAADEAEEEASELWQLSSAIVEALELDRTAYLATASHRLTAPSDGADGARPVPSALVLISPPEIWEPTPDCPPSSPLVAAGDGSQHGRK